MIEHEENSRPLPVFRLMNIALFVEFAIFVAGAILSSVLSVNAGQ
jgi:hypothetical protein